MSSLSSCLEYSSLYIICAFSTTCAFFFLFLFNYYYFYFLFLFIICYLLLFVSYFYFLSTIYCLFIIYYLFLFVIYYLLFIYFYYFFASGGRLAYLIPTVLEFTVQDLPIHPCLRFIRLCEQQLSTRHGRHAVLMVKYR